MNRLPPEKITQILHRVCVKREPIKAVKFDLNLHHSTIQKWVRKYEEKAA